MFHVRRRPADYHPRKRKKKPQQGKWGPPNEMLDYRYEDGVDRLPFFLELNPGKADLSYNTLCPTTVSVLVQFYGIASIFGRNRFL